MPGRAILAIAVGESAFACAEMSPRGDEGPRRSGVFSWPGGVTLDQPQQLGLALRAYLREHRFTAKAAAFGIPARWVIAQERELPPAPPAESLAMLRLQAEKLTASDAAEMTFDFIGETDSDRASRVLMIGTLRRRLDQLEAVAVAAGLRVRAITPTVLALPPGGQADALTMMISGSGAELVWRREGQPHLIRHVPLSMNGHGRSMSLLGSELRRSGVPAGEGVGAEVLDAVGLTPHERSRLDESIGSGVPVRATAAPRVDDPRVAPAAAVGAATLRGRLPVDFRHSRLAAVDRSRIGRSTWWAAALGVVALVVILTEVLGYQQDVAELEMLDAQLSTLAPDLAEAEATISRTGFGRGFYDGRPAALACLAELTKAFGPLDPVWTTSVSFRQDGRGQLQGAGEDQPSVLALLDRLKGNPVFRDVTLVDLREAEQAGQRQVTFTITFRFTPPPGGGPTPAIVAASAEEAP